MKRLLLAVGLLTALLPAQERPRSPRREGPPQELQQRLEQMQQRLEELQQRLHERGVEGRERPPQRREAEPQGGEPRRVEGRMEGGAPPRGRQFSPGERGMGPRGMGPGGMAPRGMGPREMGPRVGMQGRGRGEMLRLRLLQLHRQRVGQPPHPLLHRLQQLREEGPRAGRRDMREPPRHEARGDRKHGQHGKHAKRGKHGKHQRGRDEATEA